MDLRGLAKGAHPAPGRPEGWWQQGGGQPVTQAAVMQATVKQPSVKQLTVMQMMSVTQAPVMQIKVVGPGDMRQPA